MVWRRVEPDFEPDGSLRDIYVLGTDLSDWQRVVGALQSWQPTPTLSVGTKPVAIPNSISSNFVASLLVRTKTQDCPLLSVDLGGPTINCHFYLESEIEFDLCPREFGNIEQLENLERFLAMLSGATGKDVLVTLENSPSLIVIRYEADGNGMTLIPPN